MRKIGVLADTSLFSSEEIELMENCMAGHLQCEELGEGIHRDLSHWDKADKIFSVYMSYYTQPNHARMEKLARLLFAIGQSTIYGIFPRSFYNGEKDHILALSRAQKAAVYAEAIAAERAEVKLGVLESLTAVAGDSQENLKKAVSYHVGMSARGQLLLLAAYFLRIFSGCWWHSVRQWGKEPEIAALMERYEMLAGDMLAEVFRDRVSGQDFERIMSGISMSGKWSAYGVQRVEKDVLELAAVEVPSDCEPLRFLAAVCYVNCGGWQYLKNVLSVCLAANMPVVLDVMEAVDVRGNLKKDGDLLAEDLQMDGVKYFIWALGRGKKSLAWKLYQRKAAQITGYLEEASDLEEVKSFRRMLNQMEKKAEQEKARLQEQAEVIECMLSQVKFVYKDEVKNYLERGDDLRNYKYVLEFGREKDSEWGENGWAAVKKYESRYGYDKFIRRCETMLLAGGGIHAEKLEIKDIRRIVESAASEGLTMQERMSGLGYLYGSSSGKGEKNLLKEAGRELFGKYLTGNREEFLGMLGKWDSESRLFGMLMLAEEPEKNKEALFSYMCDKSKLIRDTLRELICTHKEYEEDMIRMVSSSKKEEREIAVRVLMAWDAKKYEPIFREAYRKERSGLVKAWLEDALRAAGKQG